MKKTLLITLFLLTSMVGFSQSYLGWITKQVNFREGPSTEYSVVKSLKPGTQIFIVSTNAENNYINIIDIETNKEGYVHTSNLEILSKKMKVEYLHQVVNQQHTSLKLKSTITRI